jgi:hypothetical protein
MTEKDSDSRKDFFISYNSADRHWAEWIAWQLEEEAAYTTVLQAWDARPGSDFLQELHDATVEAERTVIVLSPDYLNALSAQVGWTTAFLKHVKGKKGTLLPVRVRECEPKGLLAPILSIDLFNQEDESKAREVLLEGVNSDRAKPKVAPLFPGGSLGHVQSPTVVGASGGVVNLLPTQPHYPKGQKSIRKTVEIFYSYAHEDEVLRDELEKHLGALKRQGLIVGWHDRRILPGKEWKKEIDEHLNTAQIILLLISADFINSDYCYGIEMKQALKRHKAGEAYVIPIILRPVDWHSSQFSKLQALPTDGKAVTEWSNRDKAFLDISKGIRKVIDEFVVKS